MARIRQYISAIHPANVPRPWLLLAMAALVLLSAYVSIRLSQPKVWIAPIAALGVMAAIWDYRPLWYVMIAAIPASLHLEMGAIAIDMPSEPMMLMFLGILFLNMVSGRQFGLQNKIFPFHLLIMALLFWTGFTALLSDFPLRSMKFMLARLWYLAAFVFMGEKILRSPRTFSADGLVYHLLWRCFRLLRRCAMRQQHCF
ncbi:MAG: hypothetical protein R3B47_01475 [Bacteroidia bacterium]